MNDYQTENIFFKQTLRFPADNVCWWQGWFFISACQLDSV